MKSVLFFLISFIAVTSSFSGLLMVANPGGQILNLSPGLLLPTPFKDFLIPGLLLAVIVGGTNLLAVFFNIRRHANRYQWAIAGGTVLCGWIAVQIILIEFSHWLHIVFLGIGLLIILIAYQLKRKWAV